MPHSRKQGGACMATRKEKELTCTVEVTEGFADRLTRGLVDIYYQRKMKAEIEGKTPEVHNEETA